MIELCLRRPFLRPLAFWMLGIGSYVLFPPYGVIGLIAFFFLVMMVILWLCGLKGNTRRSALFAGRWGWGCFFLIILYALSVWVCCYVDCFRPKWEEPSAIELWAERTQERLAERFDQLALTGEEKGVVCDLALGYGEAMDREMNRKFSVTGVSHVLAVSGFHVAVICGFFNGILCFLPRRGWARWVRYGILTTVLWSYTIMTGLAASAFRSALMLTFYLTAHVARRRTDNYNTLAAAAFCMLVIQPFVLFDIGFQLSFLAVLFIFYFMPRFERYWAVRNPLVATPWGWVGVTLAAQLGTAPLCAFYFGELSSVFLLTNLPMTFLATWLIPASLLWLFYPSGWWGGDVLEGAVVWGVQAMVDVVEVFSRLPLASVSVRFDGICLVLAYGALFMWMFHGRQKRNVMDWEINRTFAKQY